MASTNKTPNYELSQFLPKDLPTWLSDYNSDMDKIDTGMAANATKAEDALTTANASTSSANSATAAVAELTAKYTALKDIIAQADKTLSLNSVELLNPVSGLFSFYFKTNSTGTIIEAEVVIKAAFTDTTFNETGLILGDAKQPEYLTNLPKLNTLIFLLGVTESGKPVRLGLSIRTKTDGTLCFFIKTYDNIDNETVFASTTTTKYTLKNPFPNVALPTIVNFNDNVSEINVNNAETVNVTTKM